MWKRRRLTVRSTTSEPTPLPPTPTPGSRKTRVTEQSKKKTACLH